MAEILLQLNDFAIERGDHFSLAPFDWTIRQGEHWCILGPNGCGKTSVLSSITAYAPPTAGRIELFGALYGECEWQEVRKAVGVVSTGLLPFIDDQELAEDLVVSGKHACLTNWGPVKQSDRQKARSLLKKLGCESIRRCRWATLSQGERQRVLIARTLMSPVKLLFLDEPCSGLDPVARATFLARIEHLAQARKPVQVMVTHHVEEIIPSCSHVLLLGRNGVVDQGPKRQVLTDALLTRAYGHTVSIKRARGTYVLDVKL